MQVTLKKESIMELLAKQNKGLGWLADKAGITNPSLSLMLKGVRHPSPKTREKIMKALDVDDWDSIFEIKDKEVASQPMPI
jgi:transcriptional regulator with XRE-family HTH domain